MATTQVPAAPATSRSTSSTGHSPTASPRPSVSPQERARRIVEIATALASEGGYDAVQMRAVARRSSVALATLYRHYPSKTHLLIAALHAELARVQDRIDRIILRGQTPYDRLMLVVGTITRGMQRDPKLTEALVRGLMFADASAAADVDAVREMIDRLFANAMSYGALTDDQLAIARVIGDVWLANMVAWVTGRATADDVSQRLALSIALLLGHRRASDVL